MPVSHSNPRIQLPFLLIFTGLTAYSASRGHPGAEEAALVSAAGQILAANDGAHVSLLFLGVLQSWATLGDSLLWLRLSSLVAAVVALAVAPSVVRGWGGTHAAPSAMILLALSPFFVGWASVVSDASLLLAAALCCSAAFLEFAKTGKHLWVGLWLAFAILCIAVHACLILVVLVQALTMLVYHRRLQNRQRYWWVAQLLVGGAFLLLHRDRLAASSIDWSLANIDLQLLNLDGLAVGFSSFLILSGIWSCRDLRREPRHGLLFAMAAAPLLAWPLFPGDGLVLLALPALLVLVARGIRLYPRWTRQLLWCSVAVVYGRSYWHLFAGS